MRLAWVLLYFMCYIWYEYLDTNTSMMRTDDYHERYRRHWWEFDKFTPFS